MTFINTCLGFFVGILGFMVCDWLSKLPTVSESPPFVGFIFYLMTFLGAIAVAVRLND